MGNNRSERNEGENGQFDGINGARQVSRHKVGIDCLSLLDDDGESPSPESIYVEQQTFFEIFKFLENDRQRFIAMCLFNNYQQQEIAFMIGIHPSRISKHLRLMKQTIKGFLDKARK